MHYIFKIIFLSILLFFRSNAFLQEGHFYSSAINDLRQRVMYSKTIPSDPVPLSDKEEQYSAVPGSFRPSIVDKARTITHICNSGTLCTTSVIGGAEGSPFGSYVDYVLDEKGWPVMLLSAQSLHTINIKQSPMVSLFTQLPRAQSTQTTAALSRVTVMGDIVGVGADEISSLKLSFTLAHPYAEQIVGKHVSFPCYDTRFDQIYT